MNLKGPASLGLIGLLLMEPAWPQSEDLGRLFFTPAERSALDRQGAALPQAATMTIDGVIRRSHGRLTIWINGKPVSQMPERPAGLARLKVGDSIRVDSGERIGLLPGGKVTSSRAEAPPARP